MLELMADRTRRAGQYGVDSASGTDTVVAEDARSHAREELVTGAGPSETNAHTTTSELAMSGDIDERY